MIDEYDTVPIAVRMLMIVTTTNISIKVNPRRLSIFIVDWTGSRRPASQLLMLYRLCTSKMLIPT